MKKGFVLMNKYGYPVRYMTKYGQTTQINQLKNMEFFKTEVEAENLRLDLTYPDDWIIRDIEV